MLVREGKDEFSSRSLLLLNLGRNPRTRLIRSRFADAEDALHCDAFFSVTHFTAWRIFLPWRILVPPGEPLRDSFIVAVMHFLYRDAFFPAWPIFSSMWQLRHTTSTWSIFYPLVSAVLIRLLRSNESRDVWGSRNQQSIECDAFLNVWQLRHAEIGCKKMSHGGRKCITLSEKWVTPVTPKKCVTPSSRWKMHHGQSMHSLSQTRVDRDWESRSTRRADFNLEICLFPPHQTTSYSSLNNTLQPQPNLQLF